MSSEPTNQISRREAVRRVTALLGGVTFVGGSALLTACDRERARTTTDSAAATADAGKNIGAFTPADVAFLDEVADTILPDTQKSPGAKAAKTGAFMALMVTDGYQPREQRWFRDGMRKLDEASMQANKTSFVKATAPQRLALLTSLDKEAKDERDKAVAAAPDAAKPKPGAPKSAPKVAGPSGASRDTASTAAPGKEGDKFLPDARQENAPSGDVGGAVAATEGPPLPHYFSMMKQLALLGYFTSEIGYTKAMRYVETPGRFDPCVDYKAGDPAWAPHA